MKGGGGDFRLTLCTAFIVLCSSIMKKKERFRDHIYMYIYREFFDLSETCNLLHVIMLI